MIAAEKTGRKARLIELDPRYVDATVKRWETLTGGRAVKVDADHLRAEVVVWQSGDDVPASNDANVSVSNGAAS